MKPRYVCSVLLLLLSALILSAQPAGWTDDQDQGHERDRDRDQDREHGPRIILFEHADFRGGSLVIYPGDVMENLSGARFDNGRSLNDEISSIKIEGDLAVTVYENSNFRGEALRLTESVRDLTHRLLRGGSLVSWNDRISSLRVEEESRHRGPGDDRHGAGQDRRVDLDVVIRRAFQDVLLRDPADADLRQYRSYLLDQGWTELMVRDHLRDSEEYRHEGVNRIIRRAYLDLLGREPDQGGLNSYRKKFLERNWSENDLRDDLRHSAEYRSRHNGH